MKALLLIVFLISIITAYGQKALPDGWVQGPGCPATSYGVDRINRFG